MSGLKTFLRTNKLTKGLYARLSRAHHNKVLKKKRKMIAKNGVATVRYIQELFARNGMEFFFDMGTLLGIVRDGRLLKHDIDIDVAVFADDEARKSEIRDILISDGCKILYSYAVDDLGVVEESYVCNGIKFDINFYTRYEAVDVCYLLYSDPDIVYSSNDVMSVVRLECSSIDRIEKLDFAGNLVNVPKDPERYLAERYGEGWTVPDTGYIYWKGPSTHKTDKLGKRTVY